MVRFRLLVLMLFVAFTSSGCRGGHVVPLSAQPVRSQVRFVPASATLLAECRATARRVRYAVPCPMRVPALVLPGHTPMRLDATVAAGTSRCTLDVVGPGCGTWHGWVVGSSGFGYEQHLVITASPLPLRNFAKVVNGPAWYPRARVRPLGWVTVNGQRMRSVFVPPATNDGSAFAHHVVLIWTVRGHTYGIGFHNVHGIAQTLALDVALARWIKLVRP